MTAADWVARTRGVARRHSSPRRVGMAVPTVALAWVGGVPGAVAGGAVAAAALASAPTAVALGHVWLLALVPGEVPLASVVAVEASFLALFAGSDDTDLALTTVATAVLALLLAGSAWLALGRTGSVAVAGIALVVVGAVFGGTVDRVAAARLAGGGRS